MLREALPKIITDTLPGEKSKAVIERRKDAMPGAIRCNYPCVIKRGEGAMFEDLDGNIFLDWVGGVGVLNVGYSHPKLVEAVKEQSEKYFHAMMNIVTHEGYIELAEKLSEIMPVRGDKKKTMFANSGAEADENAVKIAKGYTKRPNIIVFSGAFHGRTMLTMAMTSKKAYAKGMGPFPDGVYRADFPYLYRTPGNMSEAEAVDYYVERFKKVFEECSPAEYVAAVVVEPVQGEGGFIPAPIEWVKALRKICDENGILIIADEVQSGFGRSGKMFTSEYWKDAGCAPDIISSAKSIAGGIPLSMVTARDEIFDGVTPGTIGGTYCGNPLACASALKLLEVYEEEKICDRAMEISKMCFEKFNYLKDTYEIVGDVRGIGAMIGIEFVKDKASKAPNPEVVNKIISDCVNKGLVLESAGTYSNVIRFLCPLVVSDAQLNAGFEILEQTIKANS